MYSRLARTNSRFVDSLVNYVTMNVNKEDIGGAGEIF
jgi:hypothetical protein